MKKALCFITIVFVNIAFAGDWERSITGSFSTQQGNTDLISYAFIIDNEYTGDLRLGNLNLVDSEIKFAISHTNGQLDKNLYQNDGSVSFLLDIMAHQTFSPFFLSYWAYDSTTALEKRIQLGAGGKYSLGSSGYSVSLAYLWEVENYTAEAIKVQFRWSLRPKYKKTFDNGITINYINFFQPLVQDFSNFLMENRLSLSIPTISEKLKFTLTLKEQYNSHPPANVKNRDTDIHFGITLLF